MILTASVSVFLQEIKTISIQITNDNVLNEPHENFTVELFDPSGGAVIGNMHTAIITITDDEREI